jgi:EAL domain-containing protein (putative c-di-GMP-specific phosphodiesterase class I)
MVPPAVFLPLAREEGLMLTLSRHVASHAVSDLAAWRAQGLDVALSINVSPPELLGGALVPHLLDLLRSADLPAQVLTLEVTEDSFLAEPERSRQLLLEARRAGLRISIDNYGTGFSSLSYLRDLPVAEVKLDPAFIASMCSDTRSAVIVSSTVSMVHALDMSVVAAGIETSMIAARAVTMGVDALQGYQLAAPMPSAGIPGVVRQLAISA